MKKLSNHKLITGIIQKGTGRKILLGLRTDFDITTGNINMGRGAGKYNPMVKRGVGEQTEKELLTVIVPEHQAEEVFEYIYFEAEIYEPHHGIVFQSDLLCTSEYTLPEDLAEEQE